MSADTRALHVPPSATTVSKQCEDPLQFIFDGPAFVEAGDEVSVLDGIRVGDIIQFVRVGPTELELRHAVQGPEQCYRVERGSDAETIALFAVDGPGPSHQPTE